MGERAFAFNFSISRRSPLDRAGQKPTVRRAAKIDDNQPAIVAALRQIPGVTVRSLAHVGEGMPDLIVGFRQRNFLFEVKDPDKPPSKRKLTPDQEKFFEGWRGQCHVVETVFEIVEVIK